MDYYIDPTPEEVALCRRALKYIKEEGDYYKAVLTLTPREHWNQVDANSDLKAHYSTMFHLKLGEGNYESGLAMVLPEHRFSLRAQSARRVWELYRSETQLLIMGGGAVGKSFVLEACTWADWQRDPQNTLTNIVSVTKGHARANMFGQICKLHNEIGEVVYLVGEASKEKITIAGEADTSGIFLVGIADGDQGIGRLRGLHPTPRANPHPIFGNLTRCRTILDEADQIPRGIWTDLRNAFITAETDDNEHIKILGAANPSDPNSEYGQRCEPRGGWLNHSDDDVEWNSGRGWKIYRIDPAKTENVINRKTMPGCEGMQTYAGYLQATQDAGGEDTPGWWVMCRGMFPPTGHGSAIIGNNLLQRSVGEWAFDDVPTDIYSIDTALDGGDLPILTFGRSGPARRARMEVVTKHEDGTETVSVEEVEIHPVARQVIQVDFQIALGRGDSIKVAENARDELPQDVNAFWVAVDGTGSGDGVKSALRRFIGMELMSIIYSERPTETKIMFDDDRVARAVYKNIRAELWYSMRRWLESRLILFSNVCEVDLYRELSGVRGGLIGGKYCVEKKDKYKNRNRGRSPDRAESCIQLVHLVRQRGDVDAGVFEDEKDEVETRNHYDVKTAVEYQDMFSN